MRSIHVKACVLVSEDDVKDGCFPVDGAVVSGHGEGEGGEEQEAEGDGTEEALPRHSFVCGT